MNVKNREIYENLILRHVNANDLMDLVVKNHAVNAKLLKHSFFITLEQIENFRIFGL